MDEYARFQLSRPESDHRDSAACLAGGGRQVRISAGLPLGRRLASAAWRARAIGYI
jgi:hypothetical protein